MPPHPTESAQRQADHETGRLIHKVELVLPSLEPDRPEDPVSGVDGQLARIRESKPAWVPGIGQHQPTASGPFASPDGHQGMN